MTSLSRLDRMIPWYFVAFFLVVLAVNGVMVMLAVRTHTGTVTDHPYEKGIAYNQVVQAENSQEKLGWKAQMILDGETLNVVLKDARGNTLSPNSLTVRFVRPTQDGMDFEVTPRNGKAQVRLPARGLWEMRLFATVGGTNYQQSKRVIVQ